MVIYPEKKYIKSPWLQIPNRSHDFMMDQIVIEDSDYHSYICSTYSYFLRSITELLIA